MGVSRPDPRLADRQAIIELLSTRAVASDDHDVERMVSCHTDDGTDDHGDGVSTARAFIENVAASRYGDPDNGPQKHTLANVLIDFRGDDSAFVETYHLAYHRLGMTGQQTDDLIGGRYLDELVRVDGEWLLSKRTVIYDWGHGADARDPAVPHVDSRVRVRRAPRSTKETTMTEAVLQELSDKQQITEVLYLRARAGDRRDHALALSCYHEGATETHEGFSTTAEDFLLNKSLYAPDQDAPTDTMMHLITNVLIDLHGDDAFVESYHLYLATGPADTGRTDTGQTDTMVGGRYLDTFARRDGRWAITHREVIFDWSRSEPAARRFWDSNPNQATISFGRMGPDDPLYRYVERGPEVRST